jgi:hypothetical protein
MAHFVSYWDRTVCGPHSSAAMSPSSNASAGFYARIFGLSLAAVLTTCLVLNAASPSTRCTRGVISVSASRHTVRTLGSASQAAPYSVNRTKVCATNEDGH